MIGTNCGVLCRSRSSRPQPHRVSSLLARFASERTAVSVSRCNLLITYSKQLFRLPRKIFFSPSETVSPAVYPACPRSFSAFLFFLMKDAIVESFCRGHYSTGCRLPSPPAPSTSPRQRESVNHPTNTSRGIVETNLLMWEKAMFSRG